jgi:hypothetical protein
MLPRTALAAFVLLALPAVPAVAAPPEGVSGRMVLDEVAVGLRKYRKETDEENRIRRLEKLAPTRDVRVAVVLGDVTEVVFTDFPPPIFDAAARLLTEYYIVGAPDESRWVQGHVVHCQGWWEANRADLRRRAKELPQ